LTTHGHTGWADSIIYAYDQQERLALISQTVSKRSFGSGSALDFGCGTGDFSRLLLNKGLTVCGYDPFVKPNIRSKKFFYAEKYIDIRFHNHDADLALSVTTLDHILDENELLEGLRHIHSSLKTGGVFYILEYALDSVSDRKKGFQRSGYQAFRTVREWNNLLEQTSFLIRACPKSGCFVIPRFA